MKYEKAGYDTVWSEWMPVPPPQTDVNIGMTSNVVAEYAFRSSESTAVSETVVLTNNTEEEISVQYFLAAYNSDGKMISCTVTTADLDNSESVSLTVKFSANDNVAMVKAFIVNPETLVPLYNVWTKKLAE